MSEEEIEVPSVEPSAVASLLNGLGRAVARGVVLFIRQSSRAQLKDNKGSGAVQADQPNFLRFYGVEPKSITVIDARGESGQPGAPRPQFDRLKRLCARGQVGVLVLARHDRMGRDSEASNELLDLAKKHNVVLLVGGRVFDPSRSEDLVMLRIQAALAEFENAQRRAWMMLTRHALAKQLRFALSLPAALVWASPSDQDYTKRLAAAGMSHLVSDVELRKHRAYVERDGRTYYILPYPDRDVWQAAKLMLEWFLETQDLREVLRRICEDPRWPSDRAGHIPTARSYRFDRGAHINWEPVVGRSDGRFEKPVWTLANWLKSPALYEIYSYSSGMAEDQSAPAHSLITPVFERGAFPSLGTGEMYDRVMELLSNTGGGAWRGKSYTGPRDHLLPRVVCSALRADGQLCGRRKSVFYQPNGSYQYRSISCGSRGHASAAPPGIEEVVVDIVLSTLTPQAMREMLVRVRQVREDFDRQRQQQKAEVDRLNRLAEAATELIQEARAEKKTDAEVRHRKALLGHERKLAEARRTLTDLEFEGEELERLRNGKFQILMSLGENLEELFARARRQGEMRSLLSLLTRAVYTRPIGYRTHLVEVEFETGKREGRIVFSGPMPTTQPVRVWAAGRLGALIQHDLEEQTSESETKLRAASDLLASELNERLNGEVIFGTPWTGPRVRTAALHRRFRETIDPRKGDHLTAGEIAAKCDAPAERVWRVALEGKLGPAHMREGVPCFAPTEVELQGQFEEYTRRVLAERTGWPLDDVVRVSELQNHWGWSQTEAQRNADRGAGTEFDARGFRWTRRSQVHIPRSTLAEYLQSLDGDQAELAALDPNYWMSLAEATRVLRISSLRIKTGAPVVYPAEDVAGMPEVYVWIGPGVVQKLFGPFIEDVVANRYPELNAGEFIRRDELLRSLRSRFGYPSDRFLRQAIRRRALKQVLARGDASDHIRAWVHVPTAVRLAQSVETVSGWLNGPGVNSDA